MHFEVVSRALRDLDIPEERMASRPSRALWVQEEDDSTYDAGLGEADEDFAAWLEELDPFELDEDEALEALAAFAGGRGAAGPPKRTWAQNRDLKGQLRTDRPRGEALLRTGRDPGPPGAGRGASGPPASQRGSKLEALIRATRCRKCGVKGHWAR
eukprot:4997459-Lingulodinium_polyedra.AAC.1